MRGAARRREAALPRGGRRGHAAAGAAGRRRRRRRLSSPPRPQRPRQGRRRQAGLAAAACSAQMRAHLPHLRAAQAPGRGGPAPGGAHGAHRPAGQGTHVARGRGPQGAQGDPPGLGGGPMWGSLPLQAPRPHWGGPFGSGRRRRCTGGGRLAFARSHEGGLTATGARGDVWGCSRGGGRPGRGRQLAAG